MEKKIKQLIVDLLWLRDNIHNFYTEEFKNMFLAICKHAQEISEEMQNGN